MNGKIEQGLHEKLCAYVLGESEGVDRAEVERELLRSPELRAERERLESTIGAVRDALAPAETLTPEAKQALERAVRPAKVAQFPWLRIAAGIGAVGLGWWIFAQGPTGQRDLTVAHLEAERDQVTPEKPRVKLGIDFANRAPRAEGLAKLEEVPATAPVEMRGFEVPEYRAPAVNAPSESAPVGGVFPAATAPARAAPQTVPARAAEPTGTGSVEMVVQEQAFAATGQSSSYGAGVRAEGAAKAESKSKQDAGLPAALSTPGSYRGAGDSVPPSGSKPALLTMAPSLPAPGAPATGGGGGGGAQDRLAVGLLAAGDKPGDTRRPAGDLESGKKLQDLGYVGPESRDDDSASRQQEKSWRQMTPEEQARSIELRCGTIVQDCLPRPNERPRDMFFRFWGDNPFEVTMLDKLSTFSVDVDTASYALARRYLVEGKVPEKAQVRTEEFVNYFASDVEAPRNATFSVHSDLTPSRFSADSARQMLRVVVRAKDVEKLERQPMHLTFVVDVSGSMKEQNRLETVKHALRMLVAQLDARDSIALVTFSNDARLVLPMTPVVDRASIEAAIAPLAHGGSTNSNAGLQLGYAQALTGLDPNAVNRVVFLSDGVANVGETDAAKILEGVKSIREKGIFLNTIGVGMNNHNDVLLEQLADKGDGLCNYVDSPKEIQRALVDRFTGAFQPIAKDVKIQVEFDPAQVMRYRLLGYENRAIADADFRNDAVDAGELGAGHQVTALYEIEPTGSASSAPMATVRLRWKPIRAAGASGVQEATEASFEVHAKSYKAFEAAPVGHRRALIVAQFAEILRRSIHARGESLDDLIGEATRLQGQIPGDADFAEFTALLLRAKDSILRSAPACDEMCQTIDALRHSHYLGGVFGESGRDARTLEEIEKTRRELEQRLRDLLRHQAETEAALEADRPRVR